MGISWELTRTRRRYVRTLAERTRLFCRVVRLWDYLSAAPAADQARMPSGTGLPEHALQVAIVENAD